MQVAKAQLNLQADYQRVKVEGRLDRVAGRQAGADASIENRNSGDKLSLGHGQTERWLRGNPAPQALAVRHPKAETTTTPSGDQAAKCGECDDGDPAKLGGDLVLRLMRLVLEGMLGHALETGAGVEPPAADGTSNQPPASGPADPQSVADPAALPDDTLVETTTFSYEAEQSQFLADGEVTLSDGRSFSFKLELMMQREQLSVSYSRTTLGALKDPLVVNLSLAPVTLGKGQLFDLNSDGQASETLPGLTSNSAYLALDRNGDGTINDGRELFGPDSGDGFGELAALDEDGNGVIDSGDSAFSSLRLWHSDSGSLQTLQQAGVAALFVNSVATPFQLQVNGTTAGVVRNTGVYLKDNGEAGSLQQIDVVT